MGKAGGFSPNLAFLFWLSWEVMKMMMFIPSLFFFFFPIPA